MGVNSHFPGGSGLDGIRMSPLWSLLKLKVMEVLVTTEAVRHAKLQSNSHHQQTNTQFYVIGQMPFLSCSQQTNTQFYVADIVKWTDKSHPFKALFLITVHNC